MSTIFRRAILALASAATLALVVFAFWPNPLAVDTAVVKQGPFTVTIEEEARTRVRHVYTVSAPIAARVLRISHPQSPAAVSLHVGDPVVGGQTVVALLQPAPPSFIDVRSREELKAGLAAAEAAITLAEAEVRRAMSSLELARSEHQRIEALTKSQVASVKALEKAHADLGAAEAAVASAQAQVNVRRSERESITARLQVPSDKALQETENCCLKIVSPVSGRVLKIAEESEKVVAAGAPLIEIGDPGDLEIVAELLSPDAVKVNKGASVSIYDWGGPALKGRVVRVDPAGFMKTSALGIEEQRVRAIIDILDEKSKWSRLGHDFRVTVRIDVWSSNSVLTAPASALFRNKDSWAVYLIANGIAVLRNVTIGQRTNHLAEIIHGLGVDDVVIVYPSDRVRSGSRVVARGGG